MRGGMKLLTDKLRKKIVKAETNLAEAETNLVKAETAASLAKMKSDEWIVLVEESKIAVAKSRELLYKLKYF
jgi:hypothetical protein